MTPIEPGASPTMDAIHPHELPNAIDHFPDISVLSLDCFDTLLWRDCHAPADVFTALPGLNPRQRVWAERAARIEALFRHERSEVKLPEIYRQLLPNAAADEWQARAEAETAAEARFCYGFAPTVALMRRARARGLKIIIVSDTYLDKTQLGALIAGAAGPDVLALIDTIYCSSEWGVSKGNGLLKKVVTALHLPARDILHIGDNPVADLHAGRSAGMNALHLVQFSAQTEQRLRLEASASALIHTRATPHDLAWQPHRAAISLAEPALTNPATALGFCTLGPVLSGFAEWIAAERAALAAATRGTVHTAFLMRDGYLPREVFEADPRRQGSSRPAEISRYTATAASFIDRAAIMAFIEQNVGSGLKYLLNQLLFTPVEVDRMIRNLPVKDRSAAFMKMIGSVQSINRILSRSRAMAARLVAHLDGLFDIAPGDTLLLVDLGYNGSVQNLIEPVLRRLMHVEIAGRYLLYRAQQLTGYDKRGFIDERNYDMDTLLAMAANVAVIEQLCTIAQGSVVDYHADGTPVRADVVIKGRQSDIRDRVQAGCIAFARAETEQPAMVRPGNAHGADARRRAAAAILARLMFFPRAPELAVIAQFEHDVNLGTDGTVKLFDPEIAAAGLKQRGLFYMKNSDRMYLPAELTGQGLPTSLAMVALKRFNLGLNHGDFCDRRFSLPLLVADGRDVVLENIAATPTHDGWFNAAIPIGKGRFTIGVQFGRVLEWLQVASVAFRPAEAVMGRPMAPGQDMIPATPTLEGMAEAGAGLFHAHDATGFMMVPPPAGKDAAMVLEIIFRPLVDRAPAVETPAVSPCHLNVESASA
jgi:FMN phosphatase YigB (HAD superfamily)